MADFIARKPLDHPLASGVVIALLLGSGVLAGCGSSGSNSGGSTSTGGSSSGGSSTGGSKGGTSATSGGTSNASGGNAGDTGAGVTGGTSGNGSSGSAGTTPVNQVPDHVDFLDGVRVDTLVGGSTAGEVDGDKDTALFTNPVSIARLDDGSFAVSDYDSSRVRSLDADGNVTTLPPPDGFNQPYGLASAGGVLYAQTDHNSAGDKSDETGTVWKVSGGDAVMAPFAENVGRPRALTVVDDGTLAVADYVHHVVALMNVATGELSVIAGSRDQPGFADGSGSDALFDAPAGIVMRSDGSFVVSDANNRRLRVVTPGGDVSTLAGEGSSGTVDGPGESASFVRPRALAVDARDNVYVADDGAHRIRRVSPDGSVITVAGAGGSENGFQDGKGASARFAGEEGIALSADGKILYVADGNGGIEAAKLLDFHRIRRVYLP